MSNPLSTLNTNLPSPASSFASTSTPSSGRVTKLAPMFTRSYSRPRPSPSHPSGSNAVAGPSSSPLGSREKNEDDGRARKRVKVDPLPLLYAQDKENQIIHRSNDTYMDIDPSECAWEREDGLREGRREVEEVLRVKPSIQDWFVTTPIRGENYQHYDYSKDVFGSKVRVVEEEKGDGGCWRRKAKRGLGRGIMISFQRPMVQTTPFLDTLVTRLTYCPDSPPSVLYIPSLHPWDQPRDHAPPLAVAFSNTAKLHSAYSAKANSARRLIAVAAEEGGVRIVDVDQGLGAHPDAAGWFWRAHGNAVLDLKWSNDDSRILTASGDATTRLHALDGPEPTLIASLTGHEASVKSCTFFDPTRSGVDPSVSSTVVATAGRDGNILIFDVRAPGNLATAGGGSRRSGRPRYSQGVDGFRPQIGGEIAPVMEIKSAHDPSKKKNPYSISSLLALQAMPGRLASGAAHEGVVKVWDPRFNTRSPPQPLASLPDPTCSSASRRPRGIHSMVEQPNTGDIHILTADSQIHVVRPSAISSTGGMEEAVQPVRYVHPELRSSFWNKIAFSPDGRYLASGSAKGGLMTWDTQIPPIKYKGGMREVCAVRVGTGGMQEGLGREKEVNAVDWGYDMVAACTEDSGTRIWRGDRDMAGRLKSDSQINGDWAGVVE